MPCSQEEHPHHVYQQGASLPAWVLIGLMLALLASVPARGSDGAALQAVIDDADITYRTTFHLPCSDATWQALVDDPVLFADLWNVYGYGPAYTVRATGPALHVSDPTGLAGEVTIVEASAQRRRYLVAGRVDHWAVPFMNEGDAAFVLDTAVGDTGASASTVTGELTVYVQAGNSFAGLIMRLGRSVLLDHVANRVELNLRDASKLLQRIENHPERVRRKVGPALWARLQKALPAD
jgi:hypothetical protein